MKSTEEEEQVLINKRDELEKKLINATLEIIRDLETDFKMESLL